MDRASEVRKANKDLYNLLGNSYEAIDGRRSRELFLWLKKKIAHIAAIADSREAILDVGCGSGFAARAAQGIFARSYGLDISQNILKALLPCGIPPICADVERIPLKDKTVDAVVYFSAMHHFYDYGPTVREAYRVLKPGGVIYIDHDMSRDFFNNFKFIITAYRRLSRKARALHSLKIRELHDLSEFHSDGLDASELKKCLEGAGFKLIDSYCHWYGLSPLTNIIFGERTFPKNAAPIMGFIAKK